MTSRVRILVWDLPTRLFHWLLALSCLCAYLTAESERLRNVHVMAGYAFLGLIAFRVVWGLIGTRYARFREFCYGRDEVSGYLRSLVTGSPRHYVGHNPVGGIAVFALLGLGLAAGLSGLAAFKEIGGDAFEELHEAFAAILLTLICVHVAGVIVSSVLHRENLVMGMVNGFKTGAPHEAIGRSLPWPALGAAIVAAAVLTSAIVDWTGPFATSANASQRSSRHDDD